MIILSGNLEEKDHEIQILKKEMSRVLLNNPEMTQNIFQAIDITQIDVMPNIHPAYNETREHGGINGLTPDSVEICEL